MQWNVEAFEVIFGDSERGVIILPRSLQGRLQQNGPIRQENIEQEWRAKESRSFRTTSCNQLLVSEMIPWRAFDVAELTRGANLDILKKRYPGNRRLPQTIWRHVQDLAARGIVIKLSKGRYIPAPLYRFAAAGAQ